MSGTMLLTLLEAKQQEKSFLRLVFRCKTIKQDNNDAFLWEDATRKVQLLVLVVKLEKWGTADIFSWMKTIQLKMQETMCPWCL